jgi:hypothetical protein
MYKKRVVAVVAAGSLAALGLTGTALAAGADDRKATPAASVSVTPSASPTSRDDHGGRGREVGDDNGGLRKDDRSRSAEPGDDRGRHAEPGDDRGRHAEPGDDRGRHAEPGDDKGGLRKTSTATRKASPKPTSSRTHDAGDDHGGRGREKGDDHGGRGREKGDDHGHGGHGSDD